MRLIIGGYAQGKLQYVLHKYNIKPDSVWEGRLPENIGSENQIVVIHRFHSWVKHRMLSEGCPEAEIRSFVEKHPNCIIISDEVGNGIVPMEALEREYRERTGRILVELASKAESVERVICGIGQKIK